MPPSPNPAGRPKAPPPLPAYPTDEELADYLAHRRHLMGIPTRHHQSLQDPAVRLGRCQDELAHLRRRRAADEMALAALALLEADLLALLYPTRDT